MRTQPTLQVSPSGKRRAARASANDRLRNYWQAGWSCARSRPAIQAPLRWSPAAPATTWSALGPVTRYLVVADAVEGTCAGPPEPPQSSPDSKA